MSVSKKTITYKSNCADILPHFELYPQPFAVICKGRECIVIDSIDVCLMKKGNAQVSDERDEIYGVSHIPG